MNWKMLSNRSFIIGFVLAFLVSFFGVTIGWDTVISDVIVLVVFVSLGLMIGYAIRRARGDFRL